MNSNERDNMSSAFELGLEAEVELGHSNMLEPGLELELEPGNSIELDVEVVVDNHIPD